MTDPDDQCTFTWTWEPDTYRCELPASHRPDYGWVHHRNGTAVQIENLPWNTAAERAAADALDRTERAIALQAAAKHAPDLFDATGTIHLAERYKTWISTGRMP